MAQARKSLLALSYFLIFALAFCLYLTLLKFHCRYFSHEDDAHHFNHTVEMAQHRDLNPHYFNKPALHFYLRIPFVYAAVAFEKMQGRIQSIKEIRTRDPYGIAGFSLTPSHPRILAWVRGVSVAWSCLLAAVTFFIVMSLQQPVWSGILAAFIVVFSPEVLVNADVVGVDTLMGLVCLVTSAYALRALNSYSITRLIACGLLAGLACAAKYNAAPICLVPLVLWWLHDKTKKGLSVALLTPIVGFLLGAPYSLLSFDEFWRGISYEVWHYAIAGHEGNSGERGLQQVLFYIRWLSTDGVGLVGFSLTLLGGYTLYCINRRAFLILASFPLAYLALMSFQKAHFTRNMLGIVPYCAVSIACALATIPRYFKKPLLRCVVVAALVFTCVKPLAARSYAIVHTAMGASDSRDAVIEWLKNERPSENDVAIAGPLQFPIQVFSLPGVDAFDINKRSIAELIQSGYEFFVIPADMPLDAELNEIVKGVAGEPGPQRVPHNPAISILGVKSGGFLRAAVRHQAIAELELQGDKLTPICTHSPQEPYCWINSHVTQIVIPHLTKASSFEVMSPWANQRVSVSDADQDLLASLRLTVPGEWESIPIPPQRDPTAKPLVITITQIHSPASRGMNSDQRRLGLALRATP